MEVVVGTLILLLWRLLKVVLLLCWQRRLLLLLRCERLLRWRRSSLRVGRRQRRGRPTL